MGGYPVKPTIANYIPATSTSYEFYEPFMVSVNIPLQTKNSTLHHMLHLFWGYHHFKFRCTWSSPHRTVRSSNSIFVEVTAWSPSMSLIACACPAAAGATGDKVRSTVWKTTCLVASVAIVEHQSTNADGAPAFLAPQVDGWWNPTPCFGWFAASKPSM